MCAKRYERQFWKEALRSKAARSRSMPLTQAVCRQTQQSRHASAPICRLQQPHRTRHRHLRPAELLNFKNSSPQQLLFVQPGSMYGGGGFETGASQFNGAGFMPS